MANTIQLKRSSVASKVPTTAQISLGELALNTFDGKLYTKRDQNGTASVVELSGGGGVIAESLQTISANHTITANSIGASFSDVEIASGATVTIPSTSIWRIFS